MNIKKDFVVGVLQRRPDIHSSFSWMIIEYLDVRETGDLIAAHDLESMVEVLNEGALEAAFNFCRIKERIKEKNGEICI